MRVPTIVVWWTVTFYAPVAERTTMPERRRVTRRACLGRFGAAIGAASLAGCGRLVGGETATRTPRESHCAEGDTAAPDPYDDWLLRLTPAEYTASTLAFATVNPQGLSMFPRIEAVAAPYLQFPKGILDRIRLPFRELDRLTFARPPGADRAAYAVVRKPGTPADRRAWLSRLEFQTYITEESDYRSYQRRSVTWPSINLIAFDDEHVVVTPESNETVTLDAPARSERLVDTERGDEHPYHCHHPEARALVERLPADDLVSARVRTGDDAFGSDDHRAPTGARASAFTFRLRWAGRPDAVETGTTSSPTTTDTATSEPTAADTATATGSTAAPDEPVGDLGMVVVFPPDEADVDSVKAHVENRRSAPEDGTGGLRFDDPSYERSGRVVSVSETRSVDALVD